MMKKFRTELKMVNSKFIVAVEGYQRRLQYGKIKEIVSNYNPNKMKPLDVSYRDGKYYVYDGQHRLEALRQLNGDRDLSVLCFVHYGMTAEDEAYLFATQDDNVIRVTLEDKYNALFYSGDQDMIDLKRICESCGLECNFKRNGSESKKLNCYKEVYSIYKKYGETQLRRVLNTIVAAWNGEADSLIAGIIGGMNMFILKYDGEYDEKKLVQRLKKVHPATIKRDGKLLASTFSGKTMYAVMIMNIYNKNTSSGRLESKF